MGLIAHYRLDNGAEDCIGGRDGRINGEVQWVKGALGGALDLTGGSKWVTGDGWPITNDFSYSFWAKQISSTGIGGLVGNHWHTNGPTGVNVYFRNSLTQITIATANGATRPTYTVSLITPNTEWCHYAVTCRGGWVSVYQNGQHLDTRYRDIVQDQSRAWAIGRWTASYDSYYYEGLIDDVRIYDHALSPREVRDLSLGMVGHYLLAHDATNAAGYSSGSLHGSVVFSDTMGGSAEFDNSSYIQLETGITGDPDELSASFWAKTDALETYDGLLQFDGVSGGHNEGFVISVKNSTTLRLRYWTDGGTETSWSAGDFATGRVSHFCVTLKDKTFTVYQDGEKVGERTYTNPLNLSGGVKLGLYSWSNNYFTGWIKDARIYATSLTPAQVKELYQHRASIDSEGSVHIITVNDAPVVDDSIAAFFPYRASLLSVQGSQLSPVEGDPELVEIEGRRGVDITSLSDAVSYGPALSMGKDDMSFSMWVYPRSSIATRNYTFSRARSSSQHHRYAGGFSSNLRIRAFMQGDGGTDVAFVGDKKVVLNAWNHMAWVFDRDGELSMYLNGEFAGSRSIAHWSEVNMTSSLPFRVGSYSASSLSPSSRLDGAVSDFRVYRRTLSEEEILELAAAEYYENPVGLNDRKVSEVGVTRGLVAWYPLMGDTKDYAGINHAENNGAVATAEGYVLDGSSGTSIDVAINDSARIPAPEGDVTVCAWVKPESDNTGYIVYCATGDSSSTNTHRYSLVQYPNGEIRFSAFGKSVRLTSIRRPREWQHVTLTASVEGEVLAYFNGELKGSTTSGSSDNSANNLMFGARPGGVNLASTLRDVRIYDRALSPEEVALLYNLTRPDGSKSALTQDCLYTRSQFKEVIC